MKGACRCAITLGGLVLLLAPRGDCRGDLFYRQTNLVSSVPGMAPVTDGNLKNPWGLASSATGPFWVANEKTGTATVYDGNGQKFPPGNPTVVTVRNISGNPGMPTGVVSNPTSDFNLDMGMNPATFIFATLDGSIAGWNRNVNPTATILKANVAGAEYTGLALGNVGAANFLYAANAANGKIDVFDGNFSSAALSGNFTDPNLPGGFTPYNIQNIGGTLFVTYENESTGGGIIDRFDTNGNLMSRFAASSASVPLDSPWGMALAPSTFGPFGGALLVGNEDSGQILAFNFATGQYLGQLLDAKGDPITNKGLWGLSFGNGGLGGDPNTLYFNAGIQDETQGLFGSINAVPEPSSVALLTLGLLTTLGIFRRGRIWT